MATAWEYTRAGVNLASQTRPGEPDPDLKRRAISEWLGKLNEMGDDGWELLSEHFAAGGLESGSLWVEYVGTMKRQRPSS